MRGPRMGVENSSDVATADDASSRKVWIGIGIFAIIFFFFIQDILGNINGGGIFSIKSALQAANSKAEMIDVDGAGLRTVFLDSAIIIVIGACALFNVNLKSRWLSTIIMLVMVGAGFVIDAYYDEPIMTYLLAAHGYTRCENRDHDYGNGKSKIWFNNYVLHAGDCPAKRL